MWLVLRRWNSYHSCHLLNDAALSYVRLRYMRDISSGHKLPRGPDWSSEHATHMIDANNKYKLVMVFTQRYSWLPALLCRSQSVAEARLRLSTGTKRGEKDEDQSVQNSRLVYTSPMMSWRQNFQFHVTHFSVDPQNSSSIRLEQLRSNHVKSCDYIPQVYLSLLLVWWKLPLVYKHPKPFLSLTPYLITAFP